MILLTKSPGSYKKFRAEILTMFSLLFWSKWWHEKRHFEINWPLRKVCVRKVRGKNWCKNWRKNMTSLQSRGSLRPFRVQTKGIFPHKNFLFPFPSTELWSKQHFWPKILEFLARINKRLVRLIGINVFQLFLISIYIIKFDVIKRIWKHR